MLSRIAAFCLVLSFSFPLSSAWAADTAGSVVGVLGDCIASGTGRNATLKIGDPVQVGDTIDVPANGKLKLRMNDGSIVSAASGSRLTIASYAIDAAGERREAKLAMASGLIRAIVSHSGAPSTFEVSSAVGVAAARSTDWFVDVTPEAMQVGVMSGVVDLKRATGPAAAVDIPPGSGSEISGRTPPLPPAVWPQARFDDLMARTTVNIGFCQCVDETSALKVMCVPDRGSCETACGSSHFSMLPSAPQACGDRGDGGGAGPSDAALNLEPARPGLGAAQPMSPLRRSP